MANFITLIEFLDTLSYSGYEITAKISFIEINEVDAHDVEESSDEELVIETSNQRTVTESNTVVQECGHYCLCIACSDYE